MKLSKIFSIDFLKENLKKVISRFPISLVIIFLTAILFFTELHYNKDISDFYNDRILVAIISLIMTFVFSVATYLSSENSQKNKLQRNLFQLIPIIFGIIFYNIFSLDPNDFENFLFFFLTFTGIISYLFFAPYLKNLFKQGTKQSVFYTYFYNISVVILISFIFAGVFFGLGAIAIAATDALFDLNIRDRLTYGNWAILSLSIISPIFALTQIPDKKSFLENNFIENAFFSFLIKFVATPFIYLYFIILYTYTIKVLSNFSEWPKGEVSWLVIGFSIFGYIAYIFSYIFEEKNKLIKNFRKIFPYAVIPQIFMLFYAIYLRINQYDITVNRYFVVVFGLWLLTISLYFIFSKKKNLIAIPSLLALFIIIISIIPKYNVYNYPEERQLARLKTNLQKAGIMSTEGFNPLKITPLKNYSDISQNLSKNIYSGIEYLCDFNNCESIKNLFPKIYSEIYEKSKNSWEKYHKEEIERLNKNKDKKECEYDKYGYVKNSLDECYYKKRVEKLKKDKFRGLRKWEIIHGVTDKIKVKYYFDIDEDIDNKKFFEYGRFHGGNVFPIDINGYSKIYEIKNSDYYEKDNYAVYYADKEEIVIDENRISTKEISKELLKKFGKNDNRELNKQDLIFELEGGKYKLFFRNIAIKNPDYKEDKDSYTYSYTSGFLLAK